MPQSNQATRALHPASSGKNHQRLQPPRTTAHRTAQEENRVKARDEHRQEHTRITSQARATPRSPRHNAHSAPESEVRTAPRVCQELTRHSDARHSALGDLPHKRLPTSLCAELASVPRHTSHYTPEVTNRHTVQSWPWHWTAYRRSIGSWFGAPSAVRMSTPHQNRHLRRSSNSAHNVGE